MALQTQLESTAPETAIFLVNEMNRNRIQSDQALTRILELAEQDQSLVSAAVSQLANVNEIPNTAMPLLLSAATNPDSNESTLADAIKALAKTSNAESVPAMFAALQSLSELNPKGNVVRQVRGICLRSRVVENNVAVVIAESDRSGDASFWADCALLQVASRKNASPEAKVTADAAIKQACNHLDRRLRLIQAAAKTNNHFLDELILKSVDDGDKQVAKAAKFAAKQLKLNANHVDKTPKLDSLAVAVAIDRAAGSRGDVGHGEVLFTKANCVACHTVSKDEVQKGPYLGNISQTYNRKELAAAILQPSKTIAQGFKTNIILDIDGRMVTGYITQESADRVVMRDSEGKEFSFSKDDIDVRKESLLSAMPEGLVKDHTVHDLASVLDYLESLLVRNGMAKPE
jgi:putative heme-binding domain-containing protein